MTLVISWERGAAYDQCLIGNLCFDARYPCIHVYSIHPNKEKNLQFNICTPFLLEKFQNLMFKRVHDYIIKTNIFNCIGEYMVLDAQVLLLFRTCIIKFLKILRRIRFLHNFLCFWILRSWKSFCLELKTSNLTQLLTGFEQTVYLLI